MTPSPTRDESRHCRSLVSVAQPLGLVVVVVVLEGFVVVVVVLIGFVVVVVESGGGLVEAVCVSA